MRNQNLNIQKPTKNKQQSNQQITQNSSTTQNFNIKDIMLDLKKDLDEQLPFVDYYFEEKYQNIEHLIAKRGMSLKIRKTSMEFKLIDKNIQKQKKIKKNNQYEKKGYKKVKKQ